MPYSSCEAPKRVTTMNPHAERLHQLSDRLTRLSSHQLTEVEALLDKMEQTSVEQVDVAAQPNVLPDWPHAPLHKLHGKGTWIVTAGTLHKQHWFRSSEDLNYLQRELLSKAQEYHWHLEAWAIFSNHYHFVGHALEDGSSLRDFLKHLHASTAREINQRQSQPGRPVWYNFWETELTFEKSYLARLNYVHQNAVHHGLVTVANHYPWCSAAWLERTATPAQVKTIYSFKIDKIKIVNDYEVLPIREA